MYPLRFRPLFRRYLWGGRRLGTSLGKPIGPENDYAESWETCDVGADQTAVSFGPLAGTTLGQLVANHGDELLGRHAPQGRFPLLLKYLDAARPLSVQVHPNDAQAARLEKPTLGKSEAWVVLEVGPESIIYAGLRRGVDRATLEQAIARGECDRCLASFVPKPGQCLYLPAGTVHALGGGLLVAELQQSSDTTYRLFDWNRVGSDGRPRRLHVAEALEVIDFERGPVVPETPRPTGEPGRERLVACDKFVLDRLHLFDERPLGGDDRCHIVTVLEGLLNVEGDPSGVALLKGDTIVLPAAAGLVGFTANFGAILLDGYMP